MKKIDLNLAAQAAAFKHASNAALVRELQRRGLVPKSRVKPVGARARMGGVYKLELYDSEGRLKTTREKHNLVVNAGLNWIKEFAFDAVTPTALARMGFIGIGTSSTAVTAADTDLISALVKQAFTAVTGYAAGGTGVCTVETTFAAGTGTGAITEAGVFNNVTLATGQMWNRVTFAAVNKTATDTLKVTVTMTFTAV